MQILRVASVLIFAATSLLAFASAQTGQPPAAAPDGLPDAPGKAVLVRLCTECHGTEVVLDPPRTVPVWIDTLFAMKDFGAKGSDEEFKTIADYLITHLARVEVNKAKAEEVVLVFGVSEKVAEELVAYRDKQGGFKTIDDLKKAPGLDAAKVDALKPRLIF